MAEKELTIKAKVDVQGVEQSLNRINSTEKAAEQSFSEYIKKVNIPGFGSLNRFLGPGGLLTLGVMGLTKGVSELNKAAEELKESFRKISEENQERLHARFAASLPSELQGLSRDELQERRQKWQEQLAAARAHELGLSEQITSANQSYLNTQAHGKPIERWFENRLFDMGVGGEGSVAAHESMIKSLKEQEAIAKQKTRALENELSMIERALQVEERAIEETTSAETKVAEVTGDHAHEVLLHQIKSMSLSQAQQSLEGYIQEQAGITNRWLNYDVKTEGNEGLDKLNIEKSRIDEIVSALSDRIKDISTIKEITQPDNNPFTMNVPWLKTSGITAIGGGAGFGAINIGKSQLDLLKSIDRLVADISTTTKQNKDIILN